MKYSKSDLLEIMSQDAGTGALLKLLEQFKIQTIHEHGDLAWLAGATKFDGDTYLVFLSSSLNQDDEPKYSLKIDDVEITMSYREYVFLVNYLRKNADVIWWEENNRREKAKNWIQRLFG